MLKEIYLSIMLAGTAAVALYGIANVPLYVLASNFKGFLFSIFLFVAGMSYMKTLTS
jgi:hypothetical protein